MDSRTQSSRFVLVLRVLRLHMFMSHEVMSAFPNVGKSHTGPVVYVQLYMCDLHN